MPPQTTGDRIGRRLSAIKGGRRLMTDKVEWLGAETFVEATIK